TLAVHRSGSARCEVYPAARIAQPIESLTRSRASCTARQDDSREAAKARKEGMIHAEARRRGEARTALRVFAASHESCGAAAIRVSAPARTNLRVLRGSA